MLLFACLKLINLSNVSVFLKQKVTTREKGNHQKTRNLHNRKVAKLTKLYEKYKYLAKV
jgi:hypothetical protein